MFCAILFVLIGVCQAFTEGGSDHQCRINLVSNWNTTPFSLQVIETLSSFNQSLYEPILEKFIGFTHEDESEALINASDEELYRAAVGLLDIKETKYLVDIHLANKFVTPRIESHFHYYRTEVIPKYGKLLLDKCGSMEGSWALLNNDIYCTPDDLFAIKVFNKEQEGLLTPFDRVIGDSSSSIVILYGRFEDPHFHDLFKTLLEFTSTGSYRVVWRYIPPASSNTDFESLAGYGVDLTLKRTDYIAIDDRNAKKPENRVVETTKEGSNTIEAYHNDIEKVFDISSLDLQFTKFIADKGLDGYHYLKKIISDLPKYASYLSSYSSDVSSLKPPTGSTPPIQPELFINGRAVDEQKMNVGSIVQVLREELKFIDSFESFGVDSFQAKKFIQDFALYRQNQTKTSELEVKRYDVFEEKEKVVYLNDLERDKQYKHLKANRKAYLKPDIKPGQIPAIRENVHDSIFVINLSDPLQLFQFLQFANTVLYRDIPQQIGIVPLIQNDLDLKLSSTFLYLVHAKSIRAGFDFLQQVGNALVASEDGSPAYDMSIIDSLELPPVQTVEKLISLNKSFIQKFGIRKPHVIANGVFYEFSERWQFLVARQIYTDFLSIRSALISEDLDTSLREYLFKDSPKRRNTHLISDSPDFEGESKQIYMDVAEIEAAQGFISVEAGTCDSTPLTLTLVGHFGFKPFLASVVNALEAQSRNGCLKLRLFDTSSDLAHFEKVRGFLEDRDVNSKEMLQEIIDSPDLEVAPFDKQEKWITLETLFGVTDIFETETLAILNGEMITIDDAELEYDDFILFIESNKGSKLDFIFNQFRKELAEKSKSFTSFEAFSSMILSSFFIQDDANILTESAIPSRICTSCLDYAHAVPYRPYVANSKLDIVAVIQPTNELSQKIISVLQLFEGFDSSTANINVQIHPSFELEKMGVNRFYRGVYPNSLSFDDSGTVRDENFALFEDVPEKTLFTFDLDVPSAWVVGIKEGETDLDNVRLADTGDVRGVYELENILVEGYARGIAGIDVGGIQVELNQNEFFTDTNIMTNLGYLQLKANPGIWNLQLKSSSESANQFELLSARQLYSNKVSHSKENSPIAIMDMSGITVFPVIGLKKSSNFLSQSIKTFYNRNLGGAKKTNNNAEINIFSVASGHLYERFLGIMTESVIKHTKHSVKFWIIENYMSPTFRNNLPKLAEKYGFSYELITYKWPKWLRSQREKQRTIWGYKILFLDVLFPQNLDKVIFVDADQIVRVDMKELVDLDLEGAPYGYTPMCDSRTEMEGFRFWKQGYWDKVLGQNGLKYHISALYVIDLKKFREIKAGDILRQHYQALSADPASLSNLDQDLPNNLQSKIKIFSLPQEWLWCETWCSDESLKNAKTIDLCNNPLTKEPKLERARRQVAEWTEYDNEINELLYKPHAKEEANVHDEL